MRPVFIYVHDLRSSGVVRDALAIAQRLSQERDVTLVAGYRQGFFAQQAAAGPFRLICLADGPPGGRAKAAPARRLRPLLKEHRPVLLSVGNFGHVTVWLATRGLREVPVVYRISNEIGRPGRPVSSLVRHRWMRILARDAARLLVVSEPIARSPGLARAFATGRAIVIPSGVDLDIACARMTAPVPHPWLAEEVPVVLGIGRLSPQKDFPLLIAAAGLAHRQRRLRLAIVGGGDGAVRAELERLAHEAGLSDDFLLAGETDNVFAWLARADLFALSSKWEGSSVALLEALAAEVPIVATRSAGDAAQVLGGGRYGALVEGGDPAAFAEAMLTQLSSGAALPAGRAEHYALQAVLDRFAQALAEVG